MKFDLEKIQAAAARMAAVGDHQTARRIMVLVVTILCHAAARWTIIPALVLALITGHAFFVKALFIALAVWWLGGRMDGFASPPVGARAVPLRHSTNDRDSERVPERRFI